MESKESKQTFIITHFCQCTCSVRAFSDSYSPINNIPIVQGATAYDCPDTGQTYILVINEGLYFGTSMSHSLINPNQLRHFLAQLYKTILTLMTTSLILMPTYLIMTKDYIFLLHLKESISFLKPRYQHNKNLMIVIM